VLNLMILRVNQTAQELLTCVLQALGSETIPMKLLTIGHFGVRS